MNALSILPRIFPSPEQGCVRLVVIILSELTNAMNQIVNLKQSIFFGANDISLPETTGQHVPLHVFEDNLRRLVKHPKIQAHENIKVLLITPPPIDQWGFDWWDEPGRSARTAVIAQQYAEGVRKVGSTLR